MAWTSEKNELLRDLLKERVAIEQDRDKAIYWGISKSWIQIINTYVTNNQKQMMLNDFIDDKIIYLNKNITAEQTTTLNTISARDTLLLNKE